MQSVVICINGVLRPTTRPDSVDMVGRYLYEALKSRFRLILLDDATAAETQHWLDVHGFVGHVRAYTPPADFAPKTVAEGRLRMLGAIRNAQGADLVLECDPTCAAEEIRAGYTVMLYSPPRYLMDIWHPDHQGGPRAWDSIVDEIARQETARAGDHRLKGRDD